VLTQPQIEKLWQSKMEADARSAYFADLLACESRLKRIIVSTSFVLSSAVVVSTLASHPHISLVCAIVVVCSQGYTIGINQDAKIKSLSRLHTEWLRLSHDYDRLWSHTQDLDAEELLNRFEDRELDLSEMAASEVDHREKKWLKWLDIVHKKHENPKHEQNA
jgi:hypothetical protein